jgi:hypothetical protein
LTIRPYDQFQINRINDIPTAFTAQTMRDGSLSVVKAGISKDE